MATTTEGWFDNLLRFLGTYSAGIYLAGVLVISIPLILAWVFDYEASSTTRFVLVGASLTVMIFAYVGERRFGIPEEDDRRTGATPRDYSLRTRALVAVAVLGLGLGIYAALEINLLVGGVFFVGSYLFTRLAFRAESPSGAAE